MGTLGITFSHNSNSEGEKQGEEKMTSHHHERNPGIELDMTWAMECPGINLAAIIRRSSSHKVRRSIKMEWQSAWMLRAITCIDLTTLAGDDTISNVKRLCFKAKAPISADVAKDLGVEDLGITTGAVCVYPSRVAEAVAFLKGTGIPVASVAAGFPAGQTSMKQRLAEIEEAVAVALWRSTLLSPEHTSCKEIGKNCTKRQS